MGLFGIRSTKLYLLRRIGNYGGGLGGLRAVRGFAACDAAAALEGREPRARSLQSPGWRALPPATIGPFQREAIEWEPVEIVGRFGDV